MKFYTLSTLLVSSLLRKSTSEATPDSSNEEMAVKKWTRKDLVLQNMQNFYERRTLINTKVSDNASSNIPSFLAERMKKGRKLEDEAPPGLTPCELDIFHLWWSDVNGVYNDYETGYSYWENLT